MLDPQLKQQLAAHLARIGRPVELVAALDESEASRELRALLEEVAGLHPQQPVGWYRRQAPGPVVCFDPLHGQAGRHGNGGAGGGAGD